MADLLGTMNAKNSLSGNLNAVLGKDGISAYEVAVKNGFEGTETEWLASLKGDPFEYEDFTEEQLNSLKVKGDPGNSGVYLGSGEMPADCNVQIDPNGDVDWTIDQTFTPTSPNAQSGIAIEERLKSKVLLDITLTEEQAGAGSVRVAIPNHELLQKAKQWNIRLMHPYTEVIDANKRWYNCNIVSDKSGIGGITIANGYNTAFASSSNKAFWYITAFNTQHATREGASGSVISYYQPVTPWAEQSSANSGTNARTNLYCYSSGLFAEDNTVYLEFNNSSNFIFEAGTRLYLEVIL